MTAKSRDSQGRWRSLTIAFRVSPEENEAINQRVSLSGLTKQEYLIRRCQYKDVVVIGNPKVYKALKTQMERIYDELKRIDDGKNITPELMEAITLVSATLEPMQHETDNIIKCNI